MADNQNITETASFSNMMLGVNVKVEPVDEDIALTDQAQTDFDLQKAIDEEANELERILKKTELTRTHIQKLKRKGIDKKINKLMQNFGDNNLTGIEKIMCKICKIDFNKNVESIREHLYSKHPDPRVFDLSLIDRVVSIHLNMSVPKVPEKELVLESANKNSLLLGQNQVVKHIVIYKCTICASFFGSEPALNTHMGVSHLVSSNNAVDGVVCRTCPFCLAVYAGTADTHYCKRQRTKLPCIYCKSTFQTNLMYECHLKAYKREISSCSSCQGCYLRECAKVKHVCDHHLFKCKLCKWYLLNKSVVVKHLTEDHKIHNKFATFYTEIFNNKVLIAEENKKKFTKTYKNPKRNNVNNANSLKEVTDVVVVDVKTEDENLKSNNTTTLSNVRNDDINAELEAEAEASAMILLQLLSKQEESISDEESIQSTVSARKIDFNMHTFETHDSDDDVLIIEPAVIEPVDLVDEGNIVENQTQNHTALVNVTVKTEPIDEEMQELEDNADYTRPITPEIQNDVIKDEPIASAENDMINLSSNKDLLTDLGHIAKEDVDIQKKNELLSCDICFFQGFGRDYIMHMSKHKGAANVTVAHKLKCNNCKHVFTDLKKLDEHKETCTLNCLQCDHKSRSLEEFYEHTMVHSKSYFTQNKMPGQEYYSICTKCQTSVHRNNQVEHLKKHFDGLLEPITTETDVPVKRDLNDDQVTELLDLLRKDLKRLNYETCMICSKSFDRKDSLKRHFIEHLYMDAFQRSKNQNFLICEICNNVCTSPMDYKQHMREHGNLTLYNCSLCSKSFSDSSNFSKHKKVHNFRVLVCDYCKRKFTSKTMLIQHIAKHDLTNPVVCKVCRSEFHFESAYRRHYRERHTNSAKYSCHLCKISYHSLKDKWDHKWLAHGIRTVNADCPYCEQKFRKYIDVKRHVRLFHTEEKVYRQQKTLYRTKKKITSITDAKYIERMLKQRMTDLQDE